MQYCGKRRLPEETVLLTLLGQDGGRELEASLLPLLGLGLLVALPSLEVASKEEEGDSS